MIEAENEELFRNVPIPSWAESLYSKNYTYYIFAGGRNSAKSYTVANYIVAASLMHRNVTILCARETQKTIKYSVHALITQRIQALGYDNYFKINKTEIIALPTKTTIMYSGLWQHVDGLKSIPELKILWIEEADIISALSWEKIVPTITRNKGSKIICTFNPCYETDIVYKTFFGDASPPNSFIKTLTYRDNPFEIPETEIAQMKHLRATEYEKFLHVYEGHCKHNSVSQIFNGKWKVREFEEPEKVHKCFGLDFGFSQDPTAGIKCYIDDKNNKLYITHEAVSHNLEIDKTGLFLEARLPDLKKHIIYADSSRPETISFIRRQGYEIRAVEKGKGSVEDGIEYIKSFEQIIIHPRCKETAKEFTLYSYKVDARSGDITNIVEDKHNHTIDALRYALERCIKKKGADYSKWNFDLEIRRNKQYSIN